VNELLFKIFLILGFGRLVMTEYFRVADTRPNRVVEPSIGSALARSCIVFPVAILAIKGLMKPLCLLSQG